MTVFRIGIRQSCLRGVVLSTLFKGARSYYGAHAMLVAMYQYLENYSSYEYAACYTIACI